MLDIAFLGISLCTSLAVEANAYDVCFRLGAIIFLVGIYCKQRWGVIAFYSLLIINFVCTTFLGLGTRTHDILFTLGALAYESVWIFLALLIRKNRRTGWNVVFG